MKMNKKGLLVAPDFENVDQYIQNGTRTENLGLEIVDRNGLSDGFVVRNLLVWMHKNTKRLDNHNDARKFKRGAFEILKSGERTGCCDSCTLFTSLARGAGIPTMQIITLSKKWGKKIDEEDAKEVVGHYFAGVYLKDIYGKYSWVLVDPDREVSKTDDVQLDTLKLSNRNIGKFYSFAYVRDYFDDLGIDSIDKMGEVQLFAYRNCDKKDIFGDKDER